MKSIGEVKSKEESNNGVKNEAIKYNKPLRTGG